MKGFYSGLKEVWGPQTKGPVHLKSSDGRETFSDSKRVLARWTEHFRNLLNVPGDIEPKALENIQQRNVNTDLNEIPTMDEMAREINSDQQPKRRQSTWQRWHSSRGMEAQRYQYAQQAALTDHQSLEGRLYTSGVEGRQPCDHL